MNVRAGSIELTVGGVGSVTRPGTPEQQALYAHADVVEQRIDVQLNRLEVLVSALVRYVGLPVDEAGTPLV